METIELGKIAGYKACTKDVQSTLSLLVEFNIDLNKKLEKKHKELDARIRNLEQRLNLDQRIKLARR